MLDRKRDPRLELLIERLKEIDNAFPYHSETEAGMLDDKQLFRHLKRTYRKKKFLMPPLDLKVGDRVVAMKFGQYQFFPVHGAQGRIEDFCEDGEVLVELRSGASLKVEDQNLVVYGRKGSWWRKEKRYPETRGDYFQLRKNDLVKYIGGEVSFWGGFIEEPEFGTVIDVREPRRVQAVFDGKDDLIVKIYESHLRKIVKNNIDFDKVYREYYGGRQC